jgi:hypothetical protein
MRHLLICEGITWSQESIPNAAQLGTDTGIPTSLTNSPRSELLHTFNPANPSRQIGAEKTAVGCLVGEPTYGAKTQVNRAGQS